MSKEVGKRRVWRKETEKYFDKAIIKHMRRKLAIRIRGESERNRAILFFFL